MSKTKERSLKDRVKQIAKEQNRLFNDVWKTLILERFLTRLSRSDHQQSLIFKGGMLLAQYITIGRETIDLDFLLTNLDAEEESLRELITDIANTDLDDGFIFDSIEISEVRHIQTHYPGFDISLNAHCGGTRTKLSLDIGIGDTVTPLTKSIPLTRTQKGPVFVEEEISLQVYPLESIFAEKFETACFRGVDNSRMKDYHDLWMLTKKPEVLAIAKLDDAVKATFSHRNTNLELIPIYKDKDAEKQQNYWRSHLRGLIDEMKSILPADLNDVVTDINSWIETNLDIS